VIIVWKKVLALLFGLLILGLTVSGASATANFVNGTANVTQTALLGATPEKRPGMKSSHSLVALPSLQSPS